MAFYCNGENPRPKSTVSQRQTESVRAKTRKIKSVESHLLFQSCCLSYSLIYSIVFVYEGFTVG
jgi:hypothetical protein